MQRRASCKVSEEIMFKAGLILVVIGAVMILLGIFVWMDSTPPFIEITESGDIVEHGSDGSFGTVLVGVGLGLFVSGSIMLFENRARRKNPQYAQERAIEESDERNIMIVNKAKARAFDVTVLLCVIFSIVYLVLEDRTFLPPAGLVFLFIVALAMIWFSISFRRNKERM